MEASAAPEEQYRIPTLTTERLSLRPLRSGDEPFLISLDTGPRVMAHIHDGALTLAVAAKAADAEVYLAAHRLHFGRWMMELRASGMPVGWLQLTKYRGPRLDSTLNDYLQADYEMAAEHWGNGYATEALREVLRYGFAKLWIDRILVWTRAENRRSIRLVERCGFEQAREYSDKSGKACRVYVIWRDSDGISTPAARERARLRRAVRSRGGS